MYNFLRSVKNLVNFRSQNSGKLQRKLKNGKIFRLRRATCSKTIVFSILFEKTPPEGRRKFWSPKNYIIIQPKPFKNTGDDHKCLC